MRKILFGGLVALALLAAAAPVLAQVPIGGKVTSVIPCPHSLGYAYTVVGFGIGSGVFFYIPGVPTFLFGPPVIGEWALGLAAPAGTCGLQTEMIGTSPPAEFNLTSTNDDSGVVTGSGLY